MGLKKKKKKKAKDAIFMTDEELQELEEAKKKAKEKKLEKERLLKEMEEELRRAKLEKKRREKYEMQCEEFRNQLLQDHCSQFQKFREECRDHLIGKRREKEWQDYVSCNHLPLANDPPALNTFLNTWTLKEDQLTMDNVLAESEIILKIIQPVEDYLNNPLDMKETTIKNLRETKLNYFNQILNIVDKVSFDAIMDVTKYHKKITILQLEIYKKSDNFIFWMWAWSHGGRSEVEPENKRPERKTPIMSVTLPGILEVKRHHLRIFHTSFDPYSLQCESYYPPVVCDKPDLYEKNADIRKMEICALKLQFMNNYDEDIMPWWFMMDKEVMEDKAKRELLKKTKVKKKKTYNASEINNKTNVNTNESETTKTSPQSPGAGGTAEIKNSKSSKMFENDVPDEEDIIPYRISKPGSTEILYSRSMIDLMEKRKYDCNGPEYFPMPDPIEFLEQPDITLSECSMELYRDLLKTEKHTTFKAFMYLGDDGMSDGAMLRDINDCLNRNNPSEEKLSFTDGRVFLDWKSFRDISPDREAIREEIEDLFFGNNERIIEDGEVKLVKRDTHLRSIKELLYELDTGKGPLKNKVELKEEPEKEKEFTMNIQTLDTTTKVTNVAEMKTLEMEIASVLCQVRQDDMDSYVEKLILSSEPGSINLRQMMILGGVFEFDFFQDEPQPFVNKNGFKTQLHYGEYKLKRVLFDQIPKIRIDLAAEAERQTNLAKRQRSLRRMSRMTFSVSEDSSLEDSESVTIADDDLVWIVLKLSKKIIYFETPVPVRWNAEKMHWTKDDIYDTKWNENTHNCKLKLGKSGPFAISVPRFSNLPYYNFSVRPSSEWKKNPEIEMEITTRNFPITFKVKEETITIDKLIHSKAENISHIINVPFKFEELVVAMRSCGIDLFPDWDSFLYIDASMKKSKTLEEHLYYCIGFSAPAFEYTSLSHKTGIRDDRIYIQIRECVENAATLPKFRTLLADPFKAVFVSTEGIGLLREESEEGVGYTPDLKYLTETIASKKALRRMKKASKRTIGTLISLLTATKVLSYT